MAAGAVTAVCVAVLVVSVAAVAVAAVSVPGWAVGVAGVVVCLESWWGR